MEKETINIPVSASFNRLTGEATYTYADVPIEAVIKVAEGYAKEMHRIQHYEQDHVIK